MRSAISPETPVSISQWKKQPHVGEMPLDIVAQVIEHGDKAVAAIDKAAGSVLSLIHI